MSARSSPVVIAALLLVACDALPVGNEGGKPTKPAPETPNPVDIPPLPSAALCEDAPVGRGYLGLAGEPLELDRVDVAAGYDTRRPYRNFANNNNDWVVAIDIQKSIVQQSLERDAEYRDPGFGASFGVSPDYWYSESEIGTFAVFVTFNYAFKSCLQAFDVDNATNAQPWLAHVTSEPTADTAQDFCRNAQIKAWNRTPTVEETQACVDLALNLAEEPDFKQRWAYVCASVLSSATWLSN